MSNRLDDVLAGKEANYILPFLWQRGEEESVIREEMARVFEAGIRAVCVEARPHPDFLGPRWWRDMDIIMEEARARGMRVWVLDDDHFPTGHAAGKMKDAPAELRRSFLRENHLDAMGPRKNASFLVKPFLMDLFQPSVEGTKLVAVIAARRDAENNRLTGEMLDLTGRIQGDFLYWDVPDGCWRVFYLVSSPRGGSERQDDYINPIVPESTRVLLDAVYEPFYARYAEDFGHTFAGFFSDEPGFYNDNLQPFDYHSGLGRAGVALPWRAGLIEMLSEAPGWAGTGRDYRLYLPLLWHDGGEMTRAARYAYMDVVSRLYGEHFTQQIGDWCRAHHVEYIGHVIEDNGAHTHLGCGSGHYFRALWGQDMAGIDVVLWQLAPGFDNGFFTNVSGEGDGEFYHYGLAKMAASLGHIDPKKQGRTVCEVFGAFGWTEGLKLMKWMTDHMLVRGVNYFVPHAFSQAEFPDDDCPPHFYARGRNPQFRYYRELNRYTNRVSHLLSGGEHIASVAVLYHAEAEWSGAAMPFHRPVKALMQRQIDCDVLPADTVLGPAEVVSGALRVMGERYRALIVPESQSLPEKVLARLARLAEEGLPVLFINRLPEQASDSPQAGSGSAVVGLGGQAGVRVVPLVELAAYVQAQGWHEISLDSSQPYLRCFHVQHADMDVYMFNNEHPTRAIAASVSIRRAATGGAVPVVGYDAFQNRLVRVSAVQAGDLLSFPVRLSPYEATMLIVGEAARGLQDGAVEAASEMLDRLPQKIELSGPWTVSISAALQYPEFQPWRDLPELVDFARPAMLPAFSGTFRYEADFAWTQAAQPAVLDLGEVYETAEVWLNSERAGARICPPYLFELRGLRQGTNHLVIEVTNTLVKEQQDFLSRFTQQEPSGLLGPVRIKWEPY